MDTLMVGLLLVASFCSGYLFKGWLLGTIQKTYPIYEKVEGGDIKYKGHVTICGSSMESVLMFFVSVAMMGGKLQVHDPEVLDSDAEVWEIDLTCPTFFDSAAELIQDWKDVNE